jgi:hypothetical protein
MEVCYKILKAECTKLNLREQLFSDECISVVFVFMLCLYILLQFIPISTNSFVYQNRTATGEITDDGLQAEMRIVAITTLV